MDKSLTSAWLHNCILKSIFFYISITGYICYGMNVGVPPDSYVENLTPEVMALGGGVPGRGSVCEGRTDTFTKEAPESLLVRTARKDTAVRRQL